MSQPLREKSKKDRLWRGWRHDSRRSRPSLPFLNEGNTPGRDGFLQDSNVLPQSRRECAWCTTAACGRGRSR